MFILTYKIKSGYKQRWVATVNFSLECHSLSDAELLCINYYMIILFNQKNYCFFILKIAQKWFLPCSQISQSYILFSPLIYLLWLIYLSNMSYRTVNKYLQVLMLRVHLLENYFFTINHKTNCSQRIEIIKKYVSK